MKKIMQSLRRLFRAAPRPDPLELIVQAFALDPFRRRRSPTKRPKGDLNP
jgi:hypothetical protein